MVEFDSARILLYAGAVVIVDYDKEKQEDMLRSCDLPLLTGDATKRETETAYIVRAQVYERMLTIQRRYQLDVALKKRSGDDYITLDLAIRVSMNLHTDISWWGRLPERVSHDLGRIWQCVMGSKMIVDNGIGHRAFGFNFREIVEEIQLTTNEEVFYLKIRCSKCWHETTQPLHRHGQVSYCTNCTPTQFLPQTDPIRKLVPVQV